MSGANVARVHFIDKSCKAFGIDPSTTGAQLREQVVSRIGLKEDSCFALFEKKGNRERCLDPDDKPAELQASWDREKSDKKKGDSEPIFLFKKKIFLKDDNREMEDPISKDLIYKQALHSVVSSEYPCEQKDAIKLAGLQFQVLYGDHNHAFHVPGFLARNIQDFVPKTLLPSKRTQEWEQLILDEHEKLIGKSSEDAKSEYLQVVKGWPYYGSTFYPPCKCTSAGKSQKVIIGINYEGIRLLKPKTKQVISEHFFTEILSWASSVGTFAFEYGNPNHSEKHTFETDQGAIIAATIQTYIDILVQMLRCDSDGEETSSETNTTFSDV